MSKYIKVEDAIRIIQNEIDKVKIENDYDATFRVGLRLAKNMLSNIPTIDIVRCSDCKFNERCNLQNKYWVVDGFTEELEYCSLGKGE